MKLNIIELRDMVAEAVRQTVREAKKAKLPAERSEESVVAQRDRQVRGLPGYAHSAPLDMSKPLGKRSKVKRQGASNIGNWTSESAGGRLTGGPPKSPAESDARVKQIMAIMTAKGIGEQTALEIASSIVSKMGDGFVDPSQNALDDPGEIGLGPKGVQERAVRKLVGMVVDEEIRVARRR